MGDESDRLAALLNITTPANPGRPAPWSPPPDSGYATEPAAARNESAAEPAGADTSDDGSGGGAPAGSSPGAQAAPAEPAPWDPAAVSEIFGRTIAAAEAQQTRVEETLAATRQRTYAAESADGEVRVTVDGRPRVVEVHVSARAVRDGADALGAAITEAANAAVRLAKAGTNEALLDGLDPTMRAAIEEGLAATEDTGRSGR